MLFVFVCVGSFVDVLVLIAIRFVNSSVVMAFLFGYCCFARALMIHLCHFVFLLLVFWFDFFYFSEFVLFMFSQQIT